MKVTHIIIMSLCLAGCIGAPSTQVQSIIPHRIVLKHPGIAANRAQSYTLSQTLDKRGHPTGYTMVIDSVVCTDRLCKVAKVTMVWDALGVYQNYTLADDAVLEKAAIDHANTQPKNKAWAEKGIPFSEVDHTKLDQILRDPSSVLRTQRASNLTGFRDKSRIDGVTGATPLTVREAVVEGAALSSFHLWHWANGDVVSAARELTHLSCHEDLLLSFLCSEKPHYVLFALEHLKIHKLFSPSLVSAVIQVMSGSDQDRIDLGLAYLRAAIPEQDAFYDKLATLFSESNSSSRIYMIKLLDSEKELPGTLLDKMSLGLQETSTYYELHLFLSLTEKHKHVSKQILTQTARFLDNENFFLARRAFWYLRKQSLDEQMSHRVKAFLEKSR